MILSEISIKRPVLATVMSLVIVLMGFLSYSRMAVREYPNIDPPIVSVRTVYKGATAQVIESAVTQPLEDSLSGIEGIKTIKSNSREEVSQITITFLTSREVAAAAADVRDRVARIRKQLPATIDEPVVSKIEADAQAIIWIAVASDRQSPMEITDFADRYLTDPLKSLPGVSSVIIGGEPSTPCGSGSIASGLQRRASPYRTSRTRSSTRTSNRRAGALRARSANSRCSRAPTCAPRTISTT